MPLVWIEGNARHGGVVSVVPEVSYPWKGTQLYTYSLKAYVVHHGLSPKSGHYTTVLMRGPEYWLCDDERAAVLFRSHRRITTETAISSCTIVAKATRAPTMTHRPCGAVVR